MPRPAIKATIRRGEQAARREIGSLVGRDLRELERLYKSAADSLQEEIRAAGGSDGNIRIQSLEVLREKIQARLRGLAGDRDELLASGLRQAARTGVTPLEDVPGLDTDLINVADEAVQFVQTFVAEDGLQLSDRLWRINRGAREAVTESLEQAVIQGHSASRAAQDFLARGESVPAAVQSKINDANADSVARQATRTLLRTDDDRSAYANALRVFRTEINRAHGNAFRAAAFAHPDVIGTRFLLSPAHPRPDICDMHARVNLYGLGPGVYPRGKSPWPAHPNTLSFEEVVFDDEVTKADNDGREDRITWLKNQNPALQESVLGSRKKRAALQAGILSQGEIGTPWRVLKERYRKRGVDVNSLDATPAGPPPQLGQKIYTQADVNIMNAELPTASNAARLMRDNADLVAEAGLELAEVQALATYTEAGAQIINTPLAQGGRLGQGEIAFAKILDSALKALASSPRARYRGKVTRTLALTPADVRKEIAGLEAGATYRTKSYFSTSKGQAHNLDVSHGLAPGVVYKVRRTRSGVDVSPFSAHPKEAEILFGQAREFIVENVVEQATDNFVVYLTERID